MLFIPNIPVCFLNDIVYCFDGMYCRVGSAEGGKRLDIQVIDFFKI